MIDSELVPDVPQDRRDAAVLLRAIRAGDGAGRGEMIDALFAALPDDALVLRLKIVSLLANDDTDEARSLLARALLQRPEDPRLSALRAACLLNRGLLNEARAEIRRALGCREHHVATRRLAARIARERGRPNEAVLHLEIAVRRRPEDPPLVAELAEALLDTGDVERAHHLLAGIVCPNPALEARVLHARGRCLDARRVLEDALAVAEPEDQDELLAALLDQAEYEGGAARVLLLAGRLTTATPRAMVQAAAGLITFGEFETAHELTGRVLVANPGQVDAWATRVVTAALLGQEHESTQALERLRGRCPSDARRRLVPLWRRALAGRLVRDQRCAHTAGSDPRISHLQPMLKRSATVLDRAADAASSASSELADLRRHAATCRSTLSSSRWKGPREQRSPEDRL